MITMQLLRRFVRRVRKYFNYLFIQRDYLIPITTEYNYRFRARHIHARLEEATRLPQLLHIEGTNICNAKCVFCAYPQMIRPKEIMEDRLFESVIDDYISLGGKHISLTPIVGDPFVDPKLFARLDYLNDRPNIERYYFYTNAILMKPQVSEDLMKYGRRLSIYLSLGGFDRETYKEIMGVDKFEQVRQNIEAFLETKRRTNSSIRLFITVRCPPSKCKGETWERFREYEKEHLLRIIEFNHYDSWAGKIKPQELRRVGLKPARMPRKLGECQRLYAKPVVLSNGSVNACACRDVEAELIIGNVREASLKEIWEGEEFKKIIALHKKGDYPEVCKRCTYYISVYDPRSLKLFSIDD
jgi:radical SAM protein with 4Fe4S-binding SPASM domain